MSDFSYISSVKYCCFCVDLKIGCIFIAIYGILDCTDIGMVTMYPICPNSTNSIVIVLKSIITIVCFISNIAMLVTSIIFLYGVLRGIKETATWFMFAILFSLTVRVAFIITALIVGLLFSCCSLFDLHIVHQAISFIIWFHFLAVVKSYRDIM
ncbi:PREDICTED: uncharacterized protein LOC106122626 [Papilio xuthus]|uniref:Uncharacterized protein LOC106122626 n=1 Tax=Papilio xuthus TaxID=66420 RepID=A0AAJ6ZK72_PAPXU|nr:PREDICTED: uncharacterized protein LOC106122626 [Papilio xuthus]